MGIPVRLLGTDILTAKKEAGKSGVNKLAFHSVLAGHTDLFFRGMVLKIQNLATLISSFLVIVN